MIPQTQRIAIGTGIHSAEWLVSTRAGQAILAESHGTDRRPRCMCQNRGVEMYVGRRGHVFYLSRMPGTGFLHADNCASVEDGTLLSGAHCYAAGAVVERADGTISLAANLERRERQADPLVEVSIDGLLDFLVEQSDLNRIQPDERPRSWSSVREKLLEVAGQICIGATPLPDILFLPDRYSRERSASDLAACESLIKSAAGHALILAPAKEVRMTTYSWQVLLKHLPGLRLWASTEAAEAIEARCQAPIFNAPAPYALSLVLVKPGRREGNYTVTNMASMPTDANFMPGRTEREAEIAGLLISEGHALLRPLRFDAPVTHVLADYAILDGNSPEPVFVLAPTGNDELDSGKRATAALLQRNGVQVKTYSP